jgi:hypothetical protein
MDSVLYHFGPMRFYIYPTGALHLPVSLLSERYTDDKLCMGIGGTLCYYFTGLLLVARLKAKDGAGIFVRAGVRLGGFLAEVKHAVLLHGGLPGNKQRYSARMFWPSNFLFRRMNRVYTILRPASSVGKLEDGNEGNCNTHFGGAVLDCSGHTSQHRKGQREEGRGKEKGTAST